MVRRQALLILGTAVLLALIWSLRASPWVRVPTGVCLGLTLVAAAFFGRRGDAFDVWWSRFLRSPIAVAGHGWLTPKWVSRGVGNQVRLPRAISPRSLGRALLIALPLMALTEIPQSRSPKFPS